jgi:hypothetical protein
MKDHIDAPVRTIRAAEPRPFPADIQLATFLTAIGVDGPSELANCDSSWPVGPKA